MFMNKIKFINDKGLRILLLIIGIIFFTHIYAQNTSDTLKGRNLYQPKGSIQNDTISVPDSQEIQAQFIRDSIEARLRFIADSIEAREIFVRDSIIRRQRILDSLIFLKTELPRLIEASLKTVTEQIIVYSNEIKIIGDSTLSNYTCRILPFSVDQPFTPWMLTLNLSDNPIKISINTNTRKVTSIHSPLIDCSLEYGTRNNILRITGQSTILNKSSGKLYKVPIDSVFFDNRGRVINIKRYIQFYRVVNNYQKGSPLFIHLSQVKKFEYTADNLITKYQIVNFCDRWSEQDERKVCKIVNYALNMQGKTYILTRQNDPANNYSDGTFNFEFDNQYNLASVAFNNINKSENWKCIIELNEAGNVSRYVYQNNGVVRKTLLVNYYLNDSKAKYKAETITCTFEDDGNSYYQKNNTTNKVRVRDKMTGEWGAWK
jgi:hypothetical protein